jgi:glyoxylase-like metal-dependent hydrolase (beta-lactamase superfamily II)
MSKTERQEREPASSEVTELSPNVLRTQLPIHIPGLAHVNMYVILDKEGAAVVDPGLPGPGNWKWVEDRLAKAGLKSKHVHTVFVTHSHPDHFGGASRFAKQSGARIIGHRAFSFGVSPPAPEVSVEDLAPEELELRRQEVAEERAWVEELQASLARGRTPWGTKRPRPGLWRQLQWRLMHLLQGISFAPRISQPVEHGDVLELAGREWFVTHTPGHTADHVCLHDPEHGLFISGDHVLPTITPHIGGISSSRDPLASFFYSLDRVAEIKGVQQVLPAHGHPFRDLAARCEAIKRHHFERLERVKSISRELGPSTVQAFSQRLFQPRSWGDMAESETYAHLEHLRLAGQAERHTDSAGTWIYVAH